MIEIKERLFTDEIKRLTPILSKQTAERLSKAYLLGDEITRKRIIEMLDIMKASVLADPDLKDAPLLEPPALDGDIEVGSVLYGRKNAGPLMWNKENFMTHVGIFGSSGYGKTNLSYSLIKKLSSEGVPVIIFDFSKKNYRDLLQTDAADHVTVYTVGSNTAPFRFNPLKPPEGISKTQWAKEFAEIFDHAYWLLGGGRHIIMKALDELYETSDKPILDDLKKNIEAMSSGTSRERNWVSTAMRPLESLCMKETGEIFSLADGIKPSAFFEPGRITVLEMDTLSTNDKTFFIEITLQWIRDWLLINGEREQLQGVIILEEAHHILNREKSKKIGSETVMDLVFREMRELGLGIVYLDQHPSMVSYPALGNTSTHVYMNLGLDTRYSSDVQDAINMLGLEEEYEYYLRRLSVGHALVLMRRSQWTKPFVASFQHVQIKKGMIKDADVSRLMNRKIGIVTEEQPNTGIDSVQLEIINSIGSGRGVFTSQIYKPLKLSGTAFKEKISSLLRNGIIGVREVRIEKTKANYYFLTETGEAIFRENFSVKNKNYEIEEKAKIIFNSLGWKHTQNGGEFSIEMEGKSIKLIILRSLDRKEIEKCVNGDTYYLCASPEIRNMLLQSAAKMLDSKITKISVAMFDSFPQAGFMDFVF